MSDNSKIEWSDAAWKPMRGGSKISPGGFHDYAEMFAERLGGVAGHPFESGFDLRLVPEKLGDPIRWPQRLAASSERGRFLILATCPRSGARAGILRGSPFFAHHRKGPRSLFEQRPPRRRPFRANPRNGQHRFRRTASGRRLKTFPLCLLSRHSKRRSEQAARGAGAERGGRLYDDHRVG